MFPQLYTGASGMITSHRVLDVVSNNLSNAKTPAFRPDRPLFESYLEAGLAARDPLTAQKSPLQVELAGTWRPSQPGPLKPTGDPFHFALRGPGFFRGETAQGERLTRAGSLTRLPDGTLATWQGSFPVLDEEGSRIVLPPGKLKVASDGYLTVDDAPVARFGIVTGDLTLLQREGALLWKAAGEMQQVDPLEAGVTQGVLEESGVNTTAELATLVEAQRAFEMQQKIVNVTVNTVAKRALDLAGER